LDRWILSKLERVVKTATEEFEKCRFMNAVEATRNFVWHVFCDHYLEAAKHRLYAGGEGKTSAQKTLHYSLKRILQLLAPVTPHVADEIYGIMYADGEKESIHLSKWPSSDQSLIDVDAEKKGDLIISLIREIRKEKNKLGIPLNVPLEEVSIYTEDGEEAETIIAGLNDISETVKAADVEVLKGKGGICSVEEYPGVGFSFTFKTGGT
jgi:valyl-tRNA synthetase